MFVGGPKVVIKDRDWCLRLERGYQAFRDFVGGNRDWIDVNLAVEIIKDFPSAWKNVGNQIHYKSLRGLNKKEYKEDRKTRSYVEVVC